LIVRIDADDVDDAHPFVECVQRDGDEADGASARHGHEDISFIVRTGRSDGVSLVCFPVWMKAKEDVVAQDILHRREDALPRPQGELDDGLKVVLAELTDVNRVLDHADG
jgi:hypothetical protein